MRIQNDRVDEDLRGWGVEREFYCPVPPKSICPATPAEIESMPDENGGDAIAQRCQNESPETKPGLNLTRELQDWPMPDDTRFWPDEGDW